MKRNSLVTLLVLLAACGSQANNPLTVGQTAFTSAPPASNGNARGNLAGAEDSASAPTASTGAGTTSTTRTVQETDLYRLDGNRLYYLNGYRGLMVFDVTDVDHPVMLGRSPIYGWPVDMVVNHGVATVVVADWYGQLDDGEPFHGSIVRGLDATDPTNIRVLGEAKLGGWVQDDRVVGDVIYAVSVDYGWSYGWDDFASTSTQSVIVSSVSFANNTIRAVGKVTFPGYTGIFNVTPNSILLAHDVEPPAKATDPKGSAGGADGTVTTQGSLGGPGSYPTQTELLYLDISDPGGSIVQRGSLTVNGRVTGWGADNGRWNLDFADGKTAHLVGCAPNVNVYYCDGNSGYVLSIADFSNADAPVLVSELDIPATGWGVATRFDGDRLYLSPQNDYYGPTNQDTPFEVYDLSNPKAPALAGTLHIPGMVWNILPAPNKRVFALGNDNVQVGDQSGEAVSLKYLDATDIAKPVLLGTSTFGQGWAWTPAAGTFKAFTMDTTKGMVVLPFSGWSDQGQTYNNGLQLIDFTDTTETTAGAAHTRGWVERGIFVQNRLVSLSDLSLAVIDYTNHQDPKVVTELTLARNVITAQSQGGNVAEISTDWWGNDVTTSEVRLLPLDNVDELKDSSQAPTVNVEGVNARVFMNGAFAYVLTDVRTPVDCASVGNTGGVGFAGDVAGGKGASAAPTCYGRAEQIQVVDLTNGVQLRGKVRLPVDTWGYGGWGWGGCYWYDWYDGAEAIQVQGDAIALRRWQPVYGANGYIVDSTDALWVADLSKPDAPTLASTPIIQDPYAWWGNLVVVGSTLYASHYDWVERPAVSTDGTTTSPGVTRYYADRIDLRDRAHPKVQTKLNIPGILVGGSSSDPNVLYSIDYQWASQIAKNTFNVVRVQGDVAELLSTTSIDGWVGSTFIQGNTAYLSAQQYDDTVNNGVYTPPTVSLHALDLSQPAAPVDRVSRSAHGWGWLLGVQGDRAIVMSGWGPNGVDIYKLTPGQPPQFQQFARTLGWWANSVSRQDNNLFFSSGYWGVQRVQLQ